MVYQTSERRYPGLKPFDRSQSALFRGRQEDVMRLTNLILRGRLTVLFAKSGIGKTSILQAGAGPELESQGFLPIVLRTENTNRPLVESVRMALTLHASDQSKDYTATMDDMPESLWEMMKRLYFEAGGLPAVPVLIFDQFEEVFTLDHTHSSRRNFLQQLADLCNESTPESIHEMLIGYAQGKGKTMMSPESMQWWDKQPELRIILSIRSDFLHRLDEVSTIIPGILNNRYQLQPLNRSQATEAILTPASAPGTFASNPFTFRQDAVDTILNFLAGRSTSVEVSAVDEESLLKKQDEIEAFNLQIICQNIEESIIKNNYPPNFEVTPDLFGGKEGLEQEIRDFYIRQVANLPDMYTRKTGTAVPDADNLMLTARKLIEEDLITSSGRRNSVVLESLLEKWQVTPEFLDILVESRLLRKELRLDSYYFEISHDTLLPAVISSRHTRRAEEKEEQEKAKLTKELQEEALKRQEVEKQLNEARRQRRLARMVSLLSVGTLVLCAIMGVLFFNIWASSVKKELEAADENCRKEQFDAAGNSYKILSENKAKDWLLGGRIAERGKDAQRFKLLYDNISNNLSTGDSLFFLPQNPDFAGALAAYHLAADSLMTYQGINYFYYLKKGGTRYYRVDPERINDRINDLDLRIKSTRKTLITQFIIFQRAAESFKEAGIWGLQMHHLKSMQRLLPTRLEDKLALAKALNMHEDTIAPYIELEMEECLRGLGK